VEGGGGIFDVKVDGKLVFSKFDAGRFPEDEEILSALRGRKG
jgi:selenoprotein W-related protein